MTSSLSLGEMIQVGLTSLMIVMALFILFQEKKAKTPPAPTMPWVRKTIIALLTPYVPTDSTVQMVDFETPSFASHARCGELCASGRPASARSFPRQRGRRDLRLHPRAGIGAHQAAGKHRQLPSAAFSGAAEHLANRKWRDDGKPITDPATQKHIVKDGDKPVKLSATEWLLMSWFRPDIAKLVPLFKVDNSSAITELGLTAKAKRDQYSFAEIEPARQTLMEKMSEYREIPAKEQTPGQRMIVQLAANFLDYEMITGHFDFIRSPVGDKVDQLPAGVEKPLRLSKSLNALANAVRTSGGPPMQIPWFRDFGKGALGAMMSGNAEQQLRIFPPGPKVNEVWHGPGETIFGAINGEKEVDPEQMAWLATVTVWRRVKKGTLPAGRKLSEGVTAWNVGELRKVLNGEVSQ